MLYHVYVRRDDSRDWHFLEVFVREPTQGADLDTANFDIFSNPSNLPATVCTEAGNMAAESEEQEEVHSICHLAVQDSEGKPNRFEWRTYLVPTREVQEPEIQGDDGKPE